MEKYMPFDYDSTATDPTVYEYTATDERAFNKSNFTNGVFPQTKLVADGDFYPTSYLGGSLAVTAGTGLSVNASAGIAMVEGIKYWNSTTKNITFEQNNVEQIFDIVVEFDNINQCVLAKKKVRTSGQAITADLTRTTDIYQIAIATVTITANATAINAAMITDQRLNTNLCTNGEPVCGLVGAVSQVDTSVLYNQIMYWFNNLKANLSADAAVNLQTQVDALKANVSDTFAHSKTTTVHALTGTLPVTSGICTIKFKATAGFTAGNTFALNGTAYTAAMQGGSALDTDAFVSGDVVVIGVDVDNRKLVFKGGGSPTLDATATEPYVASGLTFYKDDAKTKLTGTGAAAKRYATGAATSGTVVVARSGYFTSSGETLTFNSYAVPLSFDFIPSVVVLKANQATSQGYYLDITCAKNGAFGTRNYNCVHNYSEVAKWVILMNVGFNLNMNIYSKEPNYSYTYYAYE